MSEIPTEAIKYCLCQKAIITDGGKVDTLYQWHGSDGHTYSPIFYNRKEADEFPTTGTFVRGEPVKSLGLPE
jgi:hypothetical protein